MFVPFGPLFLSMVLSLASLPAKAAIGGAFESGFKSYIAFEARFRDAITGKVLITYADRETQKTAFVSFKDYTYFAHIREIIDEWAQQTVKMLNRQAGKKIEDSPVFVFSPW